MGEMLPSYTLQVVVEISQDQSPRARILVQITIYRRPRIGGEHYNS